MARPLTEITRQLERALFLDLSLLTVDIASTRLDLLRELVPNGKTIAMLVIQFTSRGFLIQDRD